MTEGANNPSRHAEHIAGRESAVALKVHGVIMNFWSLFGTLTTDRDAESYRKTLFPETKTVEQLLDHLKGKTVVDLGSGLTHKNPKSLINRVGAKNDEHTLFIGIDPNVGGVKGRRPFERLSRMLERVLDRVNKKQNLPGAKFAIQGELPETTLPEKSVDIFTSNYSLGLWVRDAKQLHSIFEAMEYSLTHDGEIRIGGAIPRALFEQDDELGKCIHEHFDIQVLKNETLIFKRRSNV